MPVPPIPLPVPAALPCGSSESRTLGYQVGIDRRASVRAGASFHLGSDEAGPAAKTTTARAGAPDGEPEAPVSGAASASSAPSAPEAENAASHEPGDRQLWGDTNQYGEHGRIYQARAMTFYEGADDS